MNAIALEVAKPRPPYVMYETRSIEDRQASIDAGHYVGKDVIYAIVTPAGSKDRIERIADEWFVSLAQLVAEDRFPAEWLEAYRKQFAAWKEDREEPVDGTSIRNWSLLSPSQVRLLTDFHVRTVEDLAAANEELIARLGMGGRTLVEKAKIFVSQSGSGKLAEQHESLRIENERLATQNQELVEMVKSLTTRLEVLEAQPVSAKKL